MPDVFERRLQIRLPRNRSAFLWGPRKTGKSTLIKRLFPEARFLDLLDSELFLRLSARPKTLREFVPRDPATFVVIDEIQKVPALLDEVHWLIENRGLRFVLSGSSARKLRRAGVNLLGGRAWKHTLFPLVSAEVPDLDLDRALVAGLLPAHYLSENPARDLAAYAEDYLQQEIRSEALTRNLPAFTRFLQAAAATNGEILNYSNVARDCGVSVPTVRGYYEILEDTLIGRTLPAWRKQMKRRLISTGKFFFFDPGVVNGILGRRSLSPGTPEYGRAFEHFILHEAAAYSHYSGKEFPIAYWRTAGGAEVDLVLGDGEVAVETKAATFAGPAGSGLRLFAEERRPRACLVVSRDPAPREIEGGITVLPWREFCERLWRGGIL